MAKLLMGVVVEVLFNKPRTIQVFPISSAGGVSNSALYTLTWRKMRRKITREPSFSSSEYVPASTYSDESWVQLPDSFCPNGWEVVVKVVDKTSDLIGEATIKQDLISKEHCIDRGHLCKDYFPIIGASLEDLSKDDEWTKGEQVNAVYSVTEEKSYTVECCYGSPVPDPYQFSKTIASNKFLQDSKQMEHDQKKEFAGKSDVQVALSLKAFSLSDNGGFDNVLAHERAEKRVRGSHSFCDNDCQVQSPHTKSKNQLADETDFVENVKNNSSSFIPDMSDCSLLLDNGGLENVLAHEREEKRVRGSHSFCDNDCSQVQSPHTKLKNQLADETDFVENVNGSLTLSGFRGIAFRNHHHWIKEAGIAVMGVSAAAGYSSTSVIAKAACAIAFIVILTALWLPRKSETTVRVLTTFGAIACAAGVLVSAAAVPLS